MQTSMKIFTRVGIVILVLVLCTGCDQLTKYIAQKTLASAAPISLLRGAIRIDYAENPGGMLSLGASLPEEARFLVFVVLVAVILPLTLVFALRANSVNLWQLTGLSMTAAGGLGNLLDRLFNQGMVIDFVSFGIGNLRTGIMNLADIAIVAGVALFVLTGTPEKRQPTSP
jgi:signal peptidase II